MVVHNIDNFFKDSLWDTINTMSDKDIIVDMQDKTLSFNWEVRIEYDEKYSLKEAIEKLKEQFDTVYDIDNKECNINNAIEKYNYVCLNLSKDNITEIALLWDVDLDEGYADIDNESIILTITAGVSLKNLIRKINND